MHGGGQLAHPRGRQHSIASVANNSLYARGVSILISHCLELEAGHSSVPPLAGLKAPCRLLELKNAHARPVAHHTGRRCEEVSGRRARAEFPCSRAERGRGHEECWPYSSYPMLFRQRTAPGRSTRWGEVALWVPRLQEARRKKVRAQAEGIEGDGSREDGKAVKSASS